MRLQFINPKKTIETVKITEKNQKVSYLSGLLIVILRVFHRHRQ